jgi:ribonucleotide reductase alpha subunit
MRKHWLEKKEIKNKTKAKKEELETTKEEKQKRRKEHTVKQTCCCFLCIIITADIWIHANILKVNFLLAGKDCT